MPMAAGSCSASSWVTAKVTFWMELIGSLKERGLIGVRLVISEAHVGLANAIRRILLGGCWQHCRMYFTRNLQQRVRKTHQST
jgi:putative transposase